MASSSDNRRPAGRQPPKGRLFQKGQSGNPGGRPKIYGEIRRLAQQAAPECLELLLKIARDGHNKASARVAAIREILDRGLGKAVQAVEPGDGMKAMLPMLYLPAQAMQYQQQQAEAEPEDEEPAEAEPELLTPAAAADFLGVSIATARKRLAKVKPVSRTKGGKGKPANLYRLSDVEALR